MYITVFDAIPCDLVNAVHRVCILKALALRGHCEEALDIYDAHCTV